MAQSPTSMTADVAAAFDAYQGRLKDRLLFLRELIMETAAETEGVGPLEEGLRWGQPSYLTSRSKSGSTIRIDAHDPDLDSYALYFHCQTRLVETFRAQHPQDLTYEGNRAIVLSADDDVPVDVLRHCIAQALTYHRWK